MPAKGVSERAVLHELVHAATGFAIQKGHRAAAKFPAEAKLVKSITDLQLQIRQHRGLIGFKSDKKHPARELFNYIGADRWRDFTTNPHELLTYGLTDPWVQHILKSIPLDGPKKATVWSAFVDALRKYLGIPKGEHTALSAIIDLSEKIFDANIPGGRSTRDLDIRYPAPRATEPDAKRIKQEREKLDRLYKQRDALERAGKLTDQTKAPDVEVADKTAARMDIAETEADDVAEAFQSQRDAPEIEVGGFKVKRGEEIIDPDTGNKTTVGRLMKDMDEDDAALEAATQCKVSL